MGRHSGGNFPYARTRNLTSFNDRPNALTPSRLLRLSKNLPHDWKEQRRFLGFAA